MDPDADGVAYLVQQFACFFALFGGAAGRDDLRFSEGWAGPACCNVRAVQPARR